MPDAVWPIGRHPPDSSRDRKEPPVSTSTVSFRHFISGLLSFAFLTRTWRAHGTPFPTTLTTTALDRSSSGWFAASACTTTAEGHPAVPTGLLHLLHSTASSGLVFYIQPPSTFVFTPLRGNRASRGRSHSPPRPPLRGRSSWRQGVISARPRGRALLPLNAIVVVEGPRCACSTISMSAARRTIRSPSTVLR